MNKQRAAGGLAAFKWGGKGVEASSGRGWVKSCRRMGRTWALTGREADPEGCGQRRAPSGGCRGEQSVERTREDMTPQGQEGDGGAGWEGVVEFWICELTGGGNRLEQRVTLCSGA